MIVVNKLDVTSLSAITGNIGTITSGTINGTTIHAGGTDVTLDASGLTLTSGSASTNLLKWSSGTQIKDTSGAMAIQAAGPLGLEANGSAVGVGLDNSNNALFPYIGTLSLGTSGSRWSDLYLDTHGSVVSKLTDLENRVSSLENP